MCYIFRTFGRRYFDAVSRGGVKPDALVEVYDGECGCEDFWSLPINAFSYVYMVRSPKYIIMQELGILLSSCGIATYLYETVYLYIRELGYAPMAED